MKQTRLRNFFIIITFCIIFILGGFTMTYYHEMAHVEIFRTYGIQSEIHLFEKFPTFITRADVDDYQARCDDNCKMANDINEMIYYPIQFIYVIIGLGFLALIILRCIEIDLIKEKT